MQAEVIRIAEKPDYMQLARCLLPKIRACAEDPEFMKRYEEWKKEKGERDNGKR